MNAVLEILGNQYKIKEGEKVKIPRIDAKVGSSVKFDKVLLIDKDGDIEVGKPTIPDAVVNSTVLEHIRDKKVIVFKKKRRKGYQVKKGHKQGYTFIKIDNITC
ncbi:50S ribosomal protein L21 [candidate division KSB1 bacterium]